MNLDMAFLEYIIWNVIHTPLNYSCILIEHDSKLSCIKDSEGLGELIGREPNKAIL